MANRLHEQSLVSSALELKYERSTHLVDIISKDEDVRRLRFDIHVLEDDNDELRELLAQEEDRSDAFEKLVNDNLARAEDAEARLQEIEADLRAREQEFSSLEAENKALQNTTADATAALTEKLALTRELSILKPELEHLKAQAASTEALMTEKLSLQRQLTEVQCDVENARREAKRALAKRRNTGVEIAQEEQMEDLRRQLAKEKRTRARAEQAAEVSQTDVNVDDVRKELAREKRARQVAEEKLAEAEQASEIEDVRKDLLKAKKAKQNLEEEMEELKVELEQEKKNVARAMKRAEGVAGADEEVEELREKLAAETKERIKTEKAAQNAATVFEAQKSILDDKLNQFRTKLKSTKEKLKETEAKLAAATAAASEAPVKKPTAKEGKKRTAAQIEVDETTLGTPGDGPAAKRGRNAARVGDKSTFSMTPFLNKTKDAADSESDDENVDESPVAKKQPLATQPASKANEQKKAATQRKQKAPVLEIVTEEAEDEHSQGQENTKAAGTKVKTKTSDGPEKPTANKKKVRKSIHDFAAFNLEPEIKQKKRKLGGLGKTLFDEEDDAPVKAMPGRGLFGSKGFGAFGSQKGGGLLGAPKIGSTLLTAMDGSGFQFSPLKRSRKNLDDTLRG
ncbi:Hypothetical protein R9X50_00313100 [Acrodontium crateriforme]|uniref:Uncharacterized protein n=1 Tax=Acrodontium crateriforme TaxID=150365 RepID=A0AAQ3R406_9PEZI|nr:Hypothetical protein R9X50_00313100 [Acrodontium crateriforme]